MRSRTPVSVSVVGEEKATVDKEKSAGARSGARLGLIHDARSIGSRAMTAPTELAKILPLIQLSISPVILISGLGALVISMTTRMGRIVDRSRNLAGLVRQAKGDERAHIEHQLEIMFRRARLMRIAMSCIIASIFTSGTLILLLFIGQVLEIEMARVVLGAFMVSVLLMVAGLGAFIRDVFVSLQALNIEVTRALGHEVD